MEVGIRASNRKTNWCIKRQVCADTVNKEALKKITSAFSYTQPLALGSTKG